MQKMKKRVRPHLDVQINRNAQDVKETWWTCVIPQFAQPFSFRPGPPTPNFVNLSRTLGVSLIAVCNGMLRVGHSAGRFPVKYPMQRKYSRRRGVGWGVKRACIERYKRLGRGSSKIAYLNPQHDNIYVKTMSTLKQYHLSAMKKKSTLSVKTGPLQ